MKFFSFGFSITLAFLITVALTALHFAYFSPPEGPEAPEYPDYYSYSGQTSQAGSAATMMPFAQGVQRTMVQALPAQTMPLVVSATPSATNPSLNVQQMYPMPDETELKRDAYEEEMEAYEKENEAFMKNEMIPYIKHTVIRHLITLVVLQIIAVLFIRFVSVTVGGAYAMGGLFGVFFASFGSIFLFPYLMISSYIAGATSSDQTELVDMTNFLSGIGWTAFGGVIILTIVAVLMVDGMLRFNTKSAPQLPPEAR
jgi:hypothetical protein